MWTVLLLGSLGLISLALLEGFETMVLPRRVTRGVRWTPLFYRTSWTLWRAVGTHVLKPIERVNVQLVLDRWLQTGPGPADLFGYSTGQFIPKYGLQDERKADVSEHSEEVAAVSDAAAQDVR